MIAREKPGSLKELAEIAGRNKSNLSKTLKTMSRYGLVELKEGQAAHWSARSVRSGESRYFADATATAGCVKR